MQQTETLVDWRISEEPAAAHRHFHLHHGHPNHHLSCGQSQYQTRLAYDSRVATFHNIRRFHRILHRGCIRPATCTRSLSRRPPRLTGTLNKNALQRSSASCTSCSTVAPDRLALQRLTKQRARNAGCRLISVRLTPRRLPRPPQPSMQRTPPPADRFAQDIRAILAHVLPSHAAVLSVHLLASSRLQQVYEVALSDASALLVVLPPPPILRLLRSEQNMAKSEAVVVRWLHDELSPSSPAEARLPLSASRPDPTEEQTQSFRGTTAPPEQTATVAARYRSSSDAASASSVPLKADLLRYIPSPVSLSSSLATPTEMPSLGLSSAPLTLNVFRPPPGTPIAALSSPLTAAERISVDYQAGKLVRQLSRLTPKSGHFGPALAVLAPQSMLGAPAASDLAAGMGTWSVAFHSILESILRDGEDVAVALAYPIVRKHFRRLGHLLDTVTAPSLVVVDAMDDSNLLVQRPPEKPHTEPSVPRPRKQRSASPAPPPPQKTAAGGKMRASSETPTKGSGTSYSASEDAPLADIVVTGLRDWSHCIFGDPLFATVFCDQPSAHFLSGFNGTDEKADIQSGPADTATAQEERENRAVRLLLYQCYHAVVQIVRGFYRPSRDQTTQELAARKRLTEILAKLDAIDDDPKRRLRHRRPSGDMSPAKKPRSESGDEMSKR